MADFTTTTNLNLKKPAIGGSSDKWGEYLNSDLDTIDTEIQSLKTASTSRSLESLSNVLDLTPTTGQLLQYDTANWKAATVTIPEDIEDLSNVTVSSPADGEVLAWSASNARWENQSAGVATIPAGSITTAKLSTSLQGQVNLILQTTGNPTDDQILRYNATTSRWEFQDLPGGTISALSDTDVSGISNKDVLVYNSTSGDWVSQPLAIADVTGLQTELDAKLESSDLSVSSLTDTTITTTADNSVLVYDASDSKWKNEGPSTARSSLGLAIGTDVQAYDADTTKNDVSNTFTANQIISVADNTNAALRITQTGTGNALVVEDNINPDSTPFVVNNAGQVGIGTTSPSQKLDVVGNIRAKNSSYTRYELYNEADAIDPNDYWIIEHNNDGGLRLMRRDDSAGTWGNNLILYADGTVNLSNNKMRITSAGNVGIGTSSPSQKLDVTGNINATGALTLGTALAIAEGGTGGTDAATARTNLGLGSAATTAATDYATAAQGSLADSAVQPGDDANTLGSGAATDGYVLTADGSGGTAWEAASGGGGGITDGDKGDITVSSSGTVWTIDNSVVTNAKLSLSANDSNIKTALNASGSAPIYACRAWVNFNGTGTVAIRASGNVSSITDNGVGNYTVNFTTAMPDANYSISATGCRSSSAVPHIIGPIATSAPSTSSCAIRTLEYDASSADSLYTSFAIFR